VTRHRTNRNAQRNANMPTTVRKKTRPAPSASRSTPTGPNCQPPSTRKSRAYRWQRASGPYGQPSPALRISGAGQSPKLAPAEDIALAHSGTSPSCWQRWLPPHTRWIRVRTIPSATLNGVAPASAARRSTLRYFRQRHARARASRVDELSPGSGRKLAAGQGGSSEKRLQLA